MQLITHVFRGDRIESRHVGEAAVIGPNGEVVFRTAAPERMMFARSSVKPFQAYPLVESGAADAHNLIRKELALCCASHNGEEIHLDVVRSLQRRTGISESDLVCGGHPSIDPETAETLTRANVTFTPNYNNCSGKHTGMLLAAKYLNYPSDGYTDPEHPLQQDILRRLSELIGRNDIGIGIDGCSAPNFYLSVIELARLFQRFTSGNDPVLARLYDAMTAEPYLVAGKNRFDTRVMEVLEGRCVSKTGAEGVRGFGIRIGNAAYGIALKVRDGAARASATMLLTLLEHLGWYDPAEYPEMGEYYCPVITNHAGLEVGYIRSSVVD